MMTFFEELTSNIDINAKINLNKCASIYLIINIREV